MLQRLNLADCFTQPQVAQDPAIRLRERRIMSKALWGFFCFESLASYVYLQQSLLGPPNVARCFDQDAASDNVDIFGKPFTSASPLPPFVPGILDATCDLSVALYKVMQWNAKSEDVGDEADVANRRQFYTDIQGWKQRLPRHLTAEDNFTPQTCYLHVYANEVAISILRPMHGKTLFNKAQHLFAGDMLIACAMADVNMSKQYIDTFRLVDYSAMLLCGVYNAALIFVASLDEPRATHGFVRACHMVRQIARHMPVARCVLKAIMAMAWSLDFAIPARSLPYFQGLQGVANGLADIPIAFAVPSSKALPSTAEGEQEGRLELTDMGKLLARWNAIAFD
ncbi:hypothetical protein CDD82_2507 [Ophiocordyceps australis]|uniref:Transcription factor domain-containing protein n=1 Tax=Ophiocordyceps australis TaxID=1399860 RepID=A0A2C5XV79_9HYPO|nr:hypothetical protein CDD82_2507 [Ophiocordyceps australis]